MALSAFMGQLAESVRAIEERAPWIRFETHLPAMHAWLVCTGCRKERRLELADVVLDPGVLEDAAHRHARCGE